MKRAVATALLISMTVAGCAVTVDDRVSNGKEPVSNWHSKVVIAHRGASGYLPEHTLPAKAMAYAQGAHFIEQDLVMSKDDQVIVLHDIHLEAVTDVRDVFPDRARADGRYYVVDFTLAELRQLAVLERFKFIDGIKSPVYEHRFPLGKSSFQIATFAEEIELIQGLNQSTGRSVGLYPEIKDPAFHRNEGKDISAAVLDALKTYHYDQRQDRVFLQCFDPDELRRIRSELLPAMNMDLALVQLLGTTSEFQAALTPEGMNNIASYADGIGPNMQLIVEPDSTATKLQTTNLVQLAHDRGLVVHPYTFRRDRLPAYAADYRELLEIFLDVIGVDGVFTDFPDLTVEYIESNL